MFEGRVLVKRTEFTKMAISLEPILRRLELISQPPEAKIFLDGKAIGTTPIVHRVPPGQHTVGNTLSDTQSCRSRGANLDLVGNTKAFAYRCCAAIGTTTQ